jgi:hypothetical protein
MSSSDDIGDAILLTAEEPVAQPEGRRRQEHGPGDDEAVGQFAEDDDLTDDFDEAGEDICVPQQPRPG